MADRANEPTNLTNMANAFGPYVPPEGGELEVTITVKAAPERSKKHGETVCTAGLLDDGRHIRLYPVKIDEYWKKGIPKYSRVRVRVLPSDEPASRPESHKVEGGLRPVESPLTAKGRPTPWKARMHLIQKGMRPNGMRGLRDLQAEHGTSLGIVKVRELIDFYITAPLEQVVEQADYRISPQKTLTGKPIMEGSRVDKVHHVFRYIWRCEGTCCDDEAEGQGYHNTTCEDWELFQSFRSWRTRYSDDEEFLDKLKGMYYDCLGQSDLHFAMGTPSDPVRQNSWMIVGLIYPNRPQKWSPERPSVATGKVEAGKMVRPDAKLDQVAMVDAKRPAPDGAKKWF